MKKNILYVGPYRSNNAMGKSSRNYIRAMNDSTAINLAIRPIFFVDKVYMNKGSEVLYRELENTRLDHYDMIIQHGYADSFQYDKQFGDNVCIPEIETNNIHHTGWVENINMMDRALTTSVWSRKSMIEAGVETPIDIVPEPLETIHVDGNNIIDNFEEKFIFYFAGTYQEKNNILGIISAYMLEFEKSENVGLVIKTEIADVMHDEAQKIIAYDIEKCQQSLRINKDRITAPNILVGAYDDGIIHKLHANCNCYVNAVKCDAFSENAIQAMLLGNTVIVTEGIGTNSYINSSNGFVVNAMESGVYSSRYYTNNSFTIHETWMEPSIQSLQEKMRLAYELSKAESSALTRNIERDLFTDKYFINKLL